MRIRQRDAEMHALRESKEFVSRLELKVPLVQDDTLRETLLLILHHDQVRQLESEKAEWQLERAESRRMEEERAHRYVHWPE